MKNNSTPSEGWREKIEKIFEPITPPSGITASKMIDQLLELVAKARHQERQEFVKKLFDNIVFSKDQARRIKELEENK